jgi:hypothetical protein
VGSRVTRIAVPLVGALAGTAALAIVIAAPFALFPGSNEAAPGARPPHASGEVTRVTAPPLPPERRPGAGPTETTAPTQPVSAPPPTSGGATTGDAADTSPGEVPRSRDDVSPPTTAKPTGDDHAGNGKAKGHDKANGHDKPKHHSHAYGHDKPKHHGHAYGHDKPKHHGYAKGHTKNAHATRLAFTPPRAKPDHVHPARAAKHCGRGARAHARARR